MLSTAILKGLCAFIIVKFVRSFRRVRQAEIAGTKPWGCDTCMSLWAVILIACMHVAFNAPPLTDLHLFLLVHGAAAGACRAMLALVLDAPSDVEFDLPGEGEADV